MANKSGNGAAALHSECKGKVACCNKAESIHVKVCDGGRQVVFAMLTCHRMVVLSTTEPLNALSMVILFE